MKKLYVIGNPIEHSQSPKIHNYWLKKYNKSFRYEKLQLSLNDKIFAEQKLDLRKKMKEEEIKGINITVPFKTRFMDILDDIDESVHLAKAINIIYKKDEKIIGGNTDGIGFCKSLKDDFNFSVPGIIQILGAGGAAYGILSELIKYRPRVIYVCNRTITKAQELVNNFKKANVSPSTTWEIHDLSFSVPSPVELFINTSYLGMKADHKLDNYLNRMSAQGFVYDINYNEELTIFNKMADDRGVDFKRNVNGKYMLIRQAAEAFKKWFNISLIKNDIDEAVDLLKV